MPMTVDAQEAQVKPHILALSANNNINESSHVKNEEVVEAMMRDGEPIDDREATNGVAGVMTWRCSPPPLNEVINESGGAWSLRASSSSGQHFADNVQRPMMMESAWE